VLDFKNSLLIRNRTPVDDVLIEFLFNYSSLYDEEKAVSLNLWRELLNSFVSAEFGKK
jgi:hypothetical protein